MICKNFEYKILDDETAVVTDYYGTDAAVEIPSQLDGYPVTKIGYAAFMNNCFITDVTVPDGVTSIDSYSFHFCSMLENITIPDSVTKIGNYAFYGCYNLKGIKIPNGITEIMDYTFFSCGFKSVTIPANVIKIGTRAFANCKNLENIIISDSVTNIDHAAFYGCCKLNTKKAKYKVCRIVNGRFICCGDFEYRLGEWTEPMDNPVLCEQGYHYCESLFDIFNYYWGILDEDIAIFECDIRGETDECGTDSKRVCSSLCLTKRLSKEEVIKLLNG